MGPFGRKKTTNRLPNPATTAMDGARSRVGRGLEIDDTRATTPFGKTLGLLGALDEIRHRGMLATAMALAIPTLMLSAEGGDGQRTGQRPVSFVAIARHGGSLAYSRNGGRMHVISRPGLAIRCCPEAAIAPDGRRVAYVVGAPLGRSVVYVASLGARPRAVARLPKITQGPTWSPDGSRLAVPAADDRVFVVGLRSRRTRLIQLAPGTRFLILEGWSPDSKQLLIAASEPHTTALFAVRVSDAARRSIAPLDRYGTSGSPEAAWSPTVR